MIHYKKNAVPNIKVIKNTPKYEGKYNIKKLTKIKDKYLKFCKTLKI